MHKECTVRFSRITDERKQLVDTFEFAVPHDPLLASHSEKAAYESP